MTTLQQHSQPHPLRHSPRQKPLAALLSIGAALLLGACAVGGRATAPATVYDFGPPAARMGTAFSYVSVEVKAPAWLDSPAIVYRLAYDDSLRLREYAASRWAGSPTQLLAQRLRQSLGTAGLNSNAALDCQVRVDVQEFAQVFEQAAVSQGRLQGEASLVDGERRLIARQSFSLRQAAGSADAAGGVRALVATSDDLAQLLAAWLSALDRSGQLASCRAGRSVAGGAP
ncbi:ABC transporter [Rhodocyclus tenuis]|uniref:ABC-type transport auxiliary lipoprotein family protein n=1 Tax=Rhodocyclus gracilis TaxID=2929842 RepID=UPI0012989628|nr:ABC transporter [Rhodocyclus gracilis]